MERFAVVVGEEVTNIIVWDGKSDDGILPTGSFGVKCPAVVGLGWTYASGKFTSPSPPVPAIRERTAFSVREFRARFTQAEQLAVRAASLVDMEVGLVYDDFNSADFIEVTDPDTALGVGLYIQKGLIDAARRNALLAPELVQDDAPIPPSVELALSEEVHPPI